MTTWRDKRGPREPKQLADALEKVASKLGAPGARTLGALFARWPSVVGPEIAAHARPRSLRDGVLTVLVDEPGWATQLRFLQADLIARIDAEVGTGTVREIVVRVRR